MPRCCANVPLRVVQASKGPIALFIRGKWAYRGTRRPDQPTQDLTF